MIVTLENVRVTLGQGETATTTLQGVNLTVSPGEIVMLRGRSGSGKTTLLNLVAGWNRPTEGVIRWGDDIDPQRWSDVAVVPQALGLLEELTIDENVSLPNRLQGQEATNWMERLDIAHLAGRRVHEASLGEQQRAAVARGLALRPKLLIADEPAAHQDADRLRLIWDAFRAAALQGTAILAASHHPATIGYADRLCEMDDGSLRDL